MNYKPGDKVEWRCMVSLMKYSEASGKWLPGVVVKTIHEVDQFGVFETVVVKLYNGLIRRCAGPELKIWLRKACSCGADSYTICPKHNVSCPIYMWWEELYAKR